MEKRKRILNIGCGGRPEDRATTIGDVRLDSQKLPSVTIVADAHNLPFREKVFDTIVCFEVLEHLESPIKAMSQFQRCLEPDGTIVVTVPNVWYWRKILRFWLGQYFESYRGLEIFDTDHKQAWDVYEFERLCYQVGLEFEYVGWLDWYGNKPSHGRTKLSAVEPLIKLVLPKHLRYTHTLFKLRRPS